MAAAKNIVSSPTTDTSDREILITRVFDAPRETVWAAVTDPNQVVHWWGPNGFSTTIHKMDFRPGGEWIHTMRGPDGVEYPNHTVFIEIVKPERIVYSLGGSKKDGPSARFESTWTFEEEHGKTRVTMRGVFPTAQQRDDVVKNFNALEGGKQTLGRLGDYLDKARSGKLETAPGEFSISRLFDAPRDKVWRAFTDAERMQEWWGPKGLTARVVKLDFRPGGTFLYALQLPDGQEWWGRWIYREIKEPELLVSLSSFTDAEGNPVRHPLNPNWPLEMLHTATFSEEGAKTRITVRATAYNATEIERNVFAEAFKSMEQGFTGTWDKLDEYLART